MQIFCSCTLLQVELQTLRSFYKDQGKSPFRFLPWKTGSIHFRFLPVRFLPKQTLNYI